MSQTLAFREDGLFKIVQFSDTEFCVESEFNLEDPQNIDDMTRAGMDRIIEAEQPDLIVIAGDVTASAKGDALYFLDKAAMTLERHRIPWAIVFGNHDSEGTAARQQMHQAQLTYEHCVAQPDPPGVCGNGNYVLTIADKSGKAAAALYFLDSGDYSPLRQVGGYDWIRHDQIQWYMRQSRALTAQNDGQPLPALAFFHIPLPEYHEVWNTRTCVGHRMEPICSPVVNSGLFAAMVEMGDVMGTFVGHDHANDFCGTLHGIRLCYGRSAQYVSFVDGERNDHFPTGARVIQLKAGERGFETWIRESDGHTVGEQPEHRPEVHA